MNAAIPAGAVDGVTAAVEGEQREPQKVIKRSRHRIRN